MKNQTTLPELGRRLQHLEKAIAQNERRQRRLQRAVAKGKPIRTTGEPPPKRGSPSTSPPPSSPPPPPAGVSHDHPVRFTHDNAPIFMSGSLEALDVRHVTLSERRNRHLLLLVFLVAILVGIFYMILP